MLHLLAPWNEWVCLFLSTLSPQGKPEIPAWNLERWKENWSVGLSRSLFEENEKPSKGSGMVSNTKHISHREALQQNTIVPTSPRLTNYLLTSVQPRSLLRTRLNSSSCPWILIHLLHATGQKGHRRSQDVLLIHLIFPIPLPGHKLTSASQLALTHHVLFWWVISAREQMVC